MAIQHKTIICPPEEFDQKFKEFYTKEDPSSIEITHHGHIHYILYRDDSWYEDEDEGLGSD